MGDQELQEIRATVSGPTGALMRLVATFLTIPITLWGFIAGFHVLLLGLSIWVYSPAGVTLVGVPLLLLVILWAASYQYLNISIEMTPDSLNIGRSGPIRQVEQSIEVADISEVTQQPLLGYTLLNIRYNTHRLFEPRTLLFRKSKASVVTTKILEENPNIDLQESTPMSSRIFVPMGAAILTFVVVPVFGIVRYGSASLVTNHTIVAFLLIGLIGILHLRYVLRASRFESSAS